MFSKTAAGVAAAVTLAFTGLASAATPDLPSCDSWSPAATCNYAASSRPSSYPINYVIIHKVQGTASSAASWFQNCAANASTHYIFNNSSGYCYQSVLEKDIAYHSAYYSYAQKAIGIEHGGYDNTNDVANACYIESGKETKSCIIYYSVLFSRSRIIGHSEVPGCSTPGYGGGTCSGDPGPYWNWNYYMTQCDPNPAPPATNIVDDSPSASSNWSTGTSASDKYGSNYKFRGTAATSDAASWTINVPYTGSYDISAWWTAGTNRSASAPYVLPNGSVVNKNQQSNGGKWNLLGTQSLSNGNRTTQLSCWTTTGYVVIADAVKYYGPK